MTPKPLPALDVCACACVSVGIVRGRGKGSQSIFRFYIRNVAAAATDNDYRTWHIIERFIILYTIDQNINK